MIEELEAQTLVDIFNIPVYAVPEIEEIHSLTLGNNPSPIISLLFLLKNEEKEFGSEEEIEVLKKTIAWKDLNLKADEVKVMNTASQRITFLQLTNHYPASKIVAFGIEPADISLQIEHHANKVVNFREVQFLFTSSIAELTKNEVAKKKFFEALRQMFNPSK